MGRIISCYATVTDTEEINDMRGVPSLNAAPRMGHVSAPDHMCDRGRLLPPSTNTARAHSTARARARSGDESGGGG